MIDQRLSQDVEAGARTRVQYLTQITPLDGGLEVRDSRWRYPRHVFEFNLAPGDPGSDEAFQEFRDLYYAAGGAYETFRFRHWADASGTDEAFASYDAYGVTYQLAKNYTFGATTRSRKVTLPVSGTVVIRDAGVTLDPADYTVDYTTGLVTFGAVRDLATLRADFTFDILVRFMDDEIEYLALNKELEQPVRITLIEVKQ